MNESSPKLKELIEQSQKILIISHTAPDPDAIASTFFTLNMLKSNFPRKEINANIEEMMGEQYVKLLGELNIESTKTKDAIEKYSPELIIVVDIASAAVISRDPMESNLAVVKNSGAKLAIIDHHARTEEMSPDVYVHNLDHSCAETLYRTLIKDLNLKPYDGYTQAILLGIVGDTSNLRFLKPNTTKDLLNTVTELIEAGGNMDKVQTFLGKLTMKQVKVHEEYLKNLKTTGEYTYTYISDEFFNAHKEEISDAEFSSANKIFVVNYLKSIDNASWGFTVKPLKNGDYTLSFRGEVGVIDLTVMAKHLGGGGHKGAAGGIIKADSDIDAINQVLVVIEKYKEEAYANK